MELLFFIYFVIVLSALPSRTLSYESGERPYSLKPHERRDPKEWLSKNIKFGLSVNTTFKNSNENDECSKNRIRSTRMNWNLFEEDLKAMNVTLSSDIRNGTIEQDLDHFNKSDHRTFYQAILENRSQSMADEFANIEVDGGSKSMATEDAQANTSLVQSTSGADRSSISANTRKGKQNKQDNKLYGEHAIRIQQQYTSKQVNTALVIKKACEEYGRMVPSFLNGEPHLKLVGYNFLDYSGKNTAVHCSKWLDRLNKENKKNPCQEEKFKAELEKANSMANKFLTK
ncbi:hypothetical protein DdX_18312 [Ditylenchus destructor]|uniref:Uncharacterized protein n=1 Tax=Ditylenchus destructor TaxID=166010 RepID=A0AAD4QY98_9BILA|nr:hypothetical protein DdX_18312 [Ditylenchus destructor]